MKTFATLILLGGLWLNFPLCLTAASIPDSTLVLEAYREDSKSNIEIRKILPGNKIKILTIDGQSFESENFFATENQQIIIGWDTIALSDVRSLSGVIILSKRQKVVKKVLLSIGLGITLLFLFGIMAINVVGQGLGGGYSGKPNYLPALAPAALTFLLMILLGSYRKMSTKKGWKFRLRKVPLQQ